MQKWYTKAAIVFGVITLSEFFQLFEVCFFGVTFNPIDIIMIGIGALIAVVVDTQIFMRIIPIWKYDR